MPRLPLKNQYFRHSGGALASCRPMFRHLLLLHGVCLRRKKISCSATTGRLPKAQQIRLFNGSRPDCSHGAWLASIDEVKGYPDVSRTADTLMSRPCPLAPSAKRPNCPRASQSNTALCHRASSRARLALREVIHVRKSLDATRSNKENSADGRLHRACEA